MELSSFASLGGTIDENGNATFEIALDSVDTKVDLLNVRMRFIFFKTYLHPKATVTAKITPAMLATLENDGFAKTDLPFTLNLHGIQQEMSAEVLVSLAGPDQVSIITTKPVLIKIEDFDLLGGHETLMESAGFSIVPATSVTFSVAFNRNTPGALLASASAVQDPGNIALKPEDFLSKDRLETLSRTGSISFEQASAELQSTSNALLRDIALVVRKCPGMTVQVAGFTDSWGKS